MDGYNGTIFAYGQTGSGKTYTMSGAGKNYNITQDSWEFRGIIPRVLTFVYDEIESRSDKSDYNVYISYLEIYNESAYDLLDREHLELPLEKWNKVTMFEDDDKNMHLKNLSVHYCENEKQGIDLMMMGNYIRKVSSTPMNMCSSRSHCIFTITLESKNKETENVYISKLHLVDLAGSERISKNQLEGNLLNETKYINLSLTYLEQVIVALKGKKGKKRGHVPYRNSLMTTILKDSLGGNCRTTLIACLSTDLENVEETVSTCRFAQRCGQLENMVKQNVMVDLPSQLKQLQKQNKLLCQELEYYKEGNNKDKQANIQYVPMSDETMSQQTLKNISPEEITPELIKSLKPKIEDYLSEKADYLDCKNMFEAHVCFEIIKQLYNSKMKEYIKELSYVSEKLRYYDQILAKKIGAQPFVDN